MKNRFLAILSVLVTTLALAVPAHAGDTAAVAVNTRDNSEVFRLMFQILRANGDTVDNQNAAVAASSCNTCEAVAIAIQVVLVTGSPIAVIPENFALAMNIDCNACVSLANAYQYVYMTDGQVHFTAEGNQQIADIRRRLEQLRTSDLPLDQLQAQIEDLNRQLSQVLATQLAPAGGSGDQSSTTPTDTGTSTAPSDTGTSTTPTDTGTSTTTTPTDTGTSTTPTDTGTSTTPTDTGTSTTPTDTGTSTTPTDTGTSTTPSG